MSCELATSVLHGYFDGELDAVGNAEFERHLRTCPDCAAALGAQESLRASLRRADLSERAPEALRRRIEAELFPRSRPAAKPASAARWTWLPVAATVMLAVFAGFRFLPGGGGGGEAAAGDVAIVDAHLRSLQPGHLVDVVSTDQHTVKPWFDGRIEFAPPVRDFGAQGFPLQGGRLDVVSGRTVAVVVYGRRKHVINVFVWPAAETAAAAPSSGSRLGYHWVRWRQDGMELQAVSDVSAPDLDELRRLMAG